MNKVANPHQAQGDERKIRLTAFFVLIVVIVYWLTAQAWMMALLAVDFALRSFNQSRYSPLARLSGWVVEALHWQGKPVYMPPKRFAARIGLLFTCVIFLLHLMGVSNWPVCAVLCFFAALECFIGFCAGCYVYDFLQRAKNVRS